jgi:hypothetical protein
MKQKWCKRCSLMPRPWLCDPHMMTASSRLQFIHPNPKDILSSGMEVPLERCWMVRGGLFARMFHIILCNVIELMKHVELFWDRSTTNWLRYYWILWKMFTIATLCTMTCLPTMSSYTSRKIPWIKSTLDKVYNWIMARGYNDLKESLYIHKSAQAKSRTIQNRWWVVTELSYILPLLGSWRNA